MSYFHFVKLAVSNTLRVFLFLAMAHPAMAADADVAHAKGEPAKVSTQITAPSSAKQQTPPEKKPDLEAPVGFGFG